MPGRVTELSETQIIADLIAAKKRQAAAQTLVQIPQPAKDALTITSNGAPATWQLTAIPYQGTGGSSLNLSLNGVEILEGVDYTVDYTTAIVTFSAGQQALFKATPTPADVLTADYWTTGDLIAASGAVDTGGFSDNFNRADSATTLGSPWSGTSFAATTPVGTAAFGVSSNRAYCVSSQSDGAGTIFDTYAYVLQGPDGTLDVDLPVVDTSVSPAPPLVAFRVDLANVGNNNLSAIEVSARQVMIKAAGSSFTGLSPIYTQFANGDHLTLVLAGSAITLKKNGTTIWSGSSSQNQTVANVGLCGNSVFGPGTRFDNFTWTPA